MRVEITIHIRGKGVTAPASGGSTKYPDAAGPVFRPGASRGRGRAARVLHHLGVSDALLRRSGGGRTGTRRARGVGGCRPTAASGGRFRGAAERRGAQGRAGWEPRAAGLRGRQETGGQEVAPGWGRRVRAIPSGGQGGGEASTPRTRPPCNPRRRTGGGGPPRWRWARGGGQAGRQGPAASGCAGTTTAGVALDFAADREKGRATARTPAPSTRTGEEAVGHPHFGERVRDRHLPPRLVTYRTRRTVAPAPRSTARVQGPAFPRGWESHPPDRAARRRPCGRFPRAARVPAAAPGLRRDSPGRRRTRGRRANAPEAP
jgi:hypothetical protein